MAQNLRELKESLVKLDERIVQRIQNGVDAMVGDGETPNLDHYAALFQACEREMRALPKDNPGQQLVHDLYLKGLVEMCIRVELAAEHHRPGVRLRLPRLRGG